MTYIQMILNKLRKRLPTPSLTGRAGVGLFILLLTACTETDDTISNIPADAVEMKGVSMDMLRSRGVEVAMLEDYVGRDEFDDNDIAVFTSVRRTEHPLNQFTYKDLEFKCSKTEKDGVVGIGWSRVQGKGSTLAATDVAPDRIYWTDATNNHTFIGYCTPQQGGGGEFDWKAVDNVFYGSLGDPTVSGDIDYRSEYAPGTPKTMTVNGNAKLCKDDILLTYSTVIKAEDAIAKLRFHHGLAQVRVIVNISDFAASGGADTLSVVSDMVLNDMLTMYKWTQQDSTTAALAAGDASALSSIYTSNTPAYNQKKNIKLWIPNPEGDGEHSSRTFTFYGLAVPTDYPQAVNPRDPKLGFSFKVTYPNPMDPTVMQDKPYAASISGIRFTSGKCTTISISLNHRNEKMTVGAEYDDWEFIDSPDQGSLKKNSTFLSSTTRTRDTNGNYNVTIVGDQNANADDATWLYNKGGTIVDVYGNNGDSEATAYTISTANQLLSFAYEVSQGNNGAGRDFTNKYIKLDADIHLQSVLSVDSLTKNKTYNVGLLDWIGIGSSTRRFNGTFIGGSRYITHLKGNAFFMNLGANAVVSDLNFSDVVGVTSHGAVAELNAGEIVACRVEGNVTSAAQYVGSICGENSGMIFACVHNGTTEGTANNAVVGGLLGRNDATGEIVASYHTGPLKGKTTCGVVGLAETGSTISGCYFNNTLAHPNSTVDPQHVHGVTIGTMQSNSFVTSLNDAIAETELRNTYEYKFTPGAYPRVGLKPAVKP